MRDSELMELEERKNDTLIDKKCIDYSKKIRQADFPKPKTQGYLGCSQGWG